MSKYFISFLFLFALMISGCWWSKPKIVLTPRSQIVDVGQLKAQIKNGNLLSQGGNLAVIPFKAGENAAASPLLDTLALMIVKGLADELQNTNRSFVILTDDNVEKADFILEGYIENFSQKKSLKRNTAISISAKLRKTKTNEIIFIYSDSISSVKKKIRPTELAYQLGQKLGLYLLEQSRRSQAKE